MPTSKTPIPDWSKRDSKIVVQQRIIYEIRQLPYHPVGLHSFHLPGNSMKCVQRFYDANLPIAYYTGVEENHEQFLLLTEKKKTLPKDLVKKCHFQEKILNNILLSDGDTKGREKTKIAKGFHVIYLDFMSGFNKRTKNTLTLLCNAPEIFQHTLQDGFPTMLYLTWGIQQQLQRPEELEILKRLRTRHPENEKLEEEKHQGVYLDHYLGSQGLINHHLAPWGLTAKATHRITYKEPGDKTTIMLSMGLEISQERGQKDCSTPIVYIGLQNRQTDEISLLTLAHWQSLGIFEENSIPGRARFHRTVHHLNQIGKTPQEISELSEIAGHPITPEVVKAILELPIPADIQEPLALPKVLEEKITEIPKTQEEAKLPLPSIQTLAETIYQILTNEPNHKLTFQELETQLFEKTGVSPNILEVNQNTWRNRVAHAKVKLVREGKLEPAKGNLICLKQN